MNVAHHLLLLALLASVTPGYAETVKPPLLSDTALKVELIDAFPGVETPTTVAGSPDGAIYIGNDPRDSRLNTKNPECQISRYGDLGKKPKTAFAQGLYSPAG